MLIILNIISVSNYRSKRKKEEILGFHVKTEERICLHMTCIILFTFRKVVIILREVADVER